MDEEAIGLLRTLIIEKICKVCPDRNPDGSCDRLAEGNCTLLSKLPDAAAALLKVHSDQMGPYIEAIRNDVCLRCNLRDPDGGCAVRDTDNCMLDSYLPLLVEAVEEFFGTPGRGQPLAKTGVRR
jgi:hypothetical protein